jgi:hypothetical protein
MHRTEQRDIVAETLWHDRHGVVVTPDLLAEALEIIESHYGVGRSLNQRDIADAVIALVHARQRAGGSTAPRRIPFEIPLEIRER